MIECSVYDFQKAETVQHKGCLFVIYWKDTSVYKYTWKEKDDWSDNSLIKEKFASNDRTRERCTATLVGDKRIAILGGRDADDKVTSNLYWLDLRSGKFDYGS